MHNCREVKDQITELVLDGIDGRADEVLASELTRCSECRAEFDALSATLRMTTRLRETAIPAESYWVGYHARLRQNLDDAAKQAQAKAQRRKVEPTFFLAPLRLCVRTTVPVPVPFIIAVVLAFAAIGLMAFGGARKPVSKSPSIVHVPVEVPVVQEKIVTRVVYRERRPLARTSKRIVNTPQAEGTFAKSRGADTLAGFQPTEEVKLTVIKGGSTNEK